MRKIFSILSIIIFAAFTSCEDYDPAVEVPSSLGFISGVEQVEFLADTPLHTMKVYATQKSNVDRTVVIKNILEGTNTDRNEPYSTAVDGDYTVSSTTVLIPANQDYGTFDISFNPAIPLGVSRYTTFEIELPAEGGYYINNTTGKVKVEYTPKCLFNLVNFDLVLDRYGEETDWDIKDGTGAIVASGGPYTQNSTNAIQTLPTMKFCLMDGTYTLTMRDSYGDGMVTSASVVGSYKLTRADGTVLVEASGNGFTTSISHTFSLP